MAAVAYFPGYVVRRVGAPRLRDWLQGPLLLPPFHVNYRGLLPPPANWRRFDYAREDIPIHRIATSRRLLSDVVALPFSGNFLFEDGGDPQPLYLPRLSIIPAAGGSSLVAFIRRQREMSHEHLSTRDPRAGYQWRRPPEGHRRRRDRKVPGGYQQLLHAVNRTYGTYSELSEVAHAWHWSGGDPASFLGQLAVNEAIDHAYGRRAALMRRVYDSRAYRLPVGLDFLLSPGFRYGGEEDGVETFLP